ncbi:MAG: M81 family metallopeptidase [Acidobacteria bacterium]|nr:M81 family metallopeptidase [Acidobacteriota bacterium]
MSRSRVLVCECKQEVSSFNPVLGRYEDFAICSGPALLDVHRKVGTEMCGALEVFATHPDIAVVPGYSSRAITSGGTLADGAWHKMSGKFLAAVRAAGAVDGVYLSLHGALASETEHDAEGYLVEETRKIVGPRVPIAVSLDLHGIVTDRILTHCDILTLYHTYPHVDFYETGERAARLLVRLLAGEINPIILRLEIPALVRGYELITETGCWGECVRDAIAFERSPGGLSGGMFIGNPFTDVPDLCSNVFLAADGESQLARARAEAIRIAEKFWAMREHLQQPLTPLAESIACAAAGTGRIVLVDAADATSSGAPGDSNAILRAMVESGHRRTALMPLVDAPAVERAFAAGVGARIRTPIGGALDPARHRPLELDVTVRLLSDGSFRNESHGSTWNGGRTAVLESGPFTIVVTSRAVSLYDRSLFLAHGQNPAWFDSVVVKSPHCQPQFFADGAEALINVDAPGATSANLHSLGHRRCARPIFPLDEGVEFTPHVKLYARHRS